MQTRSRHVHTHKAIDGHVASLYRQLQAICIKACMLEAGMGANKAMWSHTNHVQKACAEGMVLQPFRSKLYWLDCQMVSWGPERSPC